LLSNRKRSESTPALGASEVRGDGQIFERGRVGIS
jgi:hypothetical protein